MKSNESRSKPAGLTGRKTEKVTLELPASLVREIDAIAGEQDRNRSAQIRFFLRSSVRQLPLVADRVPRERH